MRRAQRVRVRGRAQAGAGGAARAFTLLARSCMQCNAMPYARTNALRTPMLLSIVHLLLRARAQVEALRRGVEVVVGTPGRMEDLMNDSILKLHVSKQATRYCRACTWVLHRWWSQRGGRCVRVRCSRASKATATLERMQHAPAGLAAWAAAPLSASHTRTHAARAHTRARAGGDVPRAGRGRPHAGPWV